MRCLLAAALLSGLVACPAAAQWDDDDRPIARRGYDDRGWRDADRPRFRDRDNDGPREAGRRDRLDFDRRDADRDPDEIMPRRRDRDADRRDADGRFRSDRRRDDGFRADRYDRYGPSPYGPVPMPPAPGGVFVVPPPIPGARSY